MPAERYYYPGSLIPGNTIIIEDKELHHLAHVMRQKEGDQIEIVNGKGSLAKATIETIKKREAILTITKDHETSSETNKLILYQAIPRLNRLDFIIEKTTELGITDFYLFPATRSERKTLSEQQLQRLKEQAISAMKQCGRLWLPKIELTTPIRNWKDVAEDAFFGDVNANAPALLQALRERPLPKKLSFVIGPESGLTQEETEILKNLRYEGVCLHPNILRTDTAAITAVAQITGAFLIEQRPCKQELFQDPV